MGRPALCADVLHEVEVVRMALVGVVVLAPSLMPPAVVGKEGIGSGWRVVHLGEAETVGFAYQLPVYACPTNDTNVLVLPAGGNERFPVVEALAPGQLLYGACQHAVAAVGVAPLGRLSKVRRPIRMVWPVVSWRKRRMSSGSQ